MRIARVHTYTDDEPIAESSEITLDIAPEQYIDDLGLFEDKKEFVKFMYRQEKLIRDSLEMEQYIEFLKSKHGMDTCGVHPNISRDKGFRIELHHTPFTLFDIVSAVINKRLQKGESLKMQLIAQEVMQLHYLDLCGLYACCQLCHVAIHSDEIGSKFYIPMANVWGDPKTFASMYYPYFSDALKTKWDNLCILDKGYTMIDNILPRELQKKYIYVKAIDGHDEEVISTSKLIDFISELNRPKASPKPIVRTDPDRDDDGFYVLRKRGIA